MLSFEVLLGIDRAAHDTGRRITCRIMAANRYSAAIRAEELADLALSDPVTEYTHAITVTPVNASALAKVT